MRKDEVSAATSMLMMTAQSAATNRLAEQFFSDYVMPSRKKRKNFLERKLRKMGR